MTSTDAGLAPLAPSTNTRIAPAPVAEFHTSTALVLTTMAIACGVGLRLMPLTSSFPWFDGGLFAQIIDELRSGSLMPAQVAFNGTQIPFVYPPLAFQIAALIGQVTGVSTLDLLRWIPAVGSVAVLAAFWLAMNSLVGRRVGMVATAIYALMPSAFDRLVAGGGLTRSIGLFFALLCWGSVGRYNETRRARWLVAAGATGGLSALVHPMSALLAATGTLLLLKPRGSLTDWLRSVVVVALVGLAVMLPWLAVIVSRGQLSELVVGGGQRYDPLLSVLTFFVNFVQPASLAEAMGILGFFFILLQQRWNVLAVVAACVLGPGWFFPTIGLALCGGIMLSEHVGFIRQNDNRLMVVGAVAVGISIATVSGLVESPQRLPTTKAMTWIQNHVPTEQRFLVASTQMWGSAITAEWFPYVAERRSLFTPQGKEWLGPRQFQSAVAGYERMRECVTTAHPQCLRELAADAGAPRAWLFVTPDAWNLRLALANSTIYRLRFSAEDGDVFSPVADPSDGQVESSMGP